MDIKFDMQFDMRNVRSDAARLAAAFTAAASVPHDRQNPHDTLEVVKELFCTLAKREVVPESFNDDEVAYLKQQLCDLSFRTNPGIGSRQERQDAAEQMVRAAQDMKLIP